MTRIEHARRNVRIARAAIGVTAVGAFALFAGLARASHPARHVTSTTSTRSSVTQDDSYFGDSSDSYSYLGPSGGTTPQVQSGAS